MSILLPVLRAVMPIVEELIDLIPNADKRQEKKLEYELKLQEAINAIDMAQIDVNKAEAASEHMFVAGWRPFIGWICGFAFAYHFIIQPLLIFIGSVFGTIIPTPVFDMASLYTVLMGMLGLGSLRSFEKVKGISSSKPTLPWKKEE